MLWGGNAPKRIRTLKPTYTPTVKKAIQTSRELQNTAWFNRNPVIQKKRAFLLTKFAQVEIEKQGPKMTQGQYTALLNVNLKRVGSQSRYYNKLSGMAQTLQQETIEQGITSSQLAETTQAYTDLLAKPPVQGELDIKQLLIYGGIAVVGIIALSFLIKR